MVWRFRSHDPAFGDSSPKPAAYLSRGDKVMGLIGDIYNVRGVVSKDQEPDGFEGWEVTIKWEDGRKSKLPVDMVTKIN